MKVPTAMMRVRDWDQLYENNRSREMKRTNWFPAPNDLSADGYVEIVGHEQGAAHFGVWNAVLMVASRAKPRRGFLIKDDGRPHNEESLARVTRLPEAVVRDALRRLLQIGLLEIVEPDSHEINNLPPHPGAGNPQDPAGKPQQGAVEGKGTEHHHQEGNLLEKNGTRKEPEGTERARGDLAPEHSSAASGDAFSHIGADDGGHSGALYVSPEDELKAIYQAKAGEPITVELLRAIRTNLELAGVPIADFVAAVRKQAPNKWRNPPGFLRDLSKRFHAKTRVAAQPVTAAEAAARDYQCPKCFSRRQGEGAVPGCDGLPVPCTCASPEWIARQRARGLFVAETAS
jgi:hypothetical protein